MVAVTNLGSISYLAKGKKYAFDKSVALFNEAKDLKGLRKAANLAVFANIVV